MNIVPAAQQTQSSYVNRFWTEFCGINNAYIAQRLRVPNQISQKSVHVSFFHIFRFQRRFEHHRPRTIYDNLLDKIVTNFGIGCAGWVMFGLKWMKMKKRIKNETKSASQVQLNNHNLNMCGVQLFMYDLWQSVLSQWKANENLSFTSKIQPYFFTEKWKCCAYAGKRHFNRL